MFQRDLLRTSWNEDTPSPFIMPSNSPQFSSQFQQSPTRYYLPQPYLAPGQPSIAPLVMAMGADHFAPRQSTWPVDTQNVQYATPSANAPYYGRAQAGGQYYSANAASHSVGYPESSQRTLLPEASYAAAYGMAYHQQTSASPGSAAPSGPVRSPTENQMVFHSNDTSHNFERNQSRRGGYSLDSFADTPLRMLAQPPSSFAAPHDNSQTSSPMSAGAHVFPITIPNMRHNAVESPPIYQTQSPKQSGHTLHLRHAPSDRLSDPVSPSAGVPPLVFDGEFGEDYDDDSECSLHSAGSDIAQNIQSAAESTGGFSMRRNGTQDAWSRSSFDSANGFQSPVPRDSSPPTSAESDNVNTLPTVDHSALERTKSLPTPKKSKMHQCTVCFKWFPRPSGLATHMNSHSGAKPYKCPIPTCTKSFAVRSNAKRHLRTHGIFPSAESSPPTSASFNVGFDTPLVSDVHEVGKLPAKLRWIPQSLATRSNVDYLRRTAHNDDTEEEEEDSYAHASCPVLAVPLPPVIPSSPTWDPEERYEDRNSYEDIGTSPYLSGAQWSSLPGPAVVTPRSI